MQTPQPTRPHFQFWPKRVPTEIVLPETSLWYNLVVSAQRYADKAAIRYFGNAITFRALEAQASAMAGWLQQKAGVKKGDRVLLYMQNCPQFIIAYYAILRADAVVVPVNPMNRAEEFKHYITDAQASVAICSADLAMGAEQANHELPAEQRLQHLLVTQYSDALPPSHENPEDAPGAWLTAQHPLPAGATPWSEALAAQLVPGPHTAGPDDMAVMPYTSGTTGFPKGCIHTHRSVMHNVIGGGTWSGSGAESTILAVLPLFHVTGMQYGMNGPIYSGATVVMLPRWDREVAGRLISRYQVTHWTNIPTMVIDFLGSPNLDQFDLSSLRYIGGGGAAMPQAVAERLKQQFGLNYIEGYGLSETMAPTHSNPSDRPKLQCLGVPTFNTDARVIDPVTLKEVAVNEVGEIIVRGPQVFKGYWGKPDATRDAFIEFEGKTFFRTGDLGRMDEEGYYFITDRLKRMINASGFKVWPAEVENLLYKHPDVQEACIIGTRDAYRGETVKAVVVLKTHAKGKTTPEEIIEWAKENMAAYKYPRVVEFVDALPKSGTGKVMWRALQESENARSAESKPAAA
ncbi:long-chain-fatty-acid--CoA ligase [Cupriavidus basilensis OR16]|uniref:Long-chain-fatty-acid--CoA ligase n=1 Tax=Cupriavidus basilensis OR16 TaxID=1127483 RepID=H1SFE6_9BURK|nr:long-chain fatty acid--CoA ligase [Cupriavidus basilensis]EHP38810.1 long-chain-fatty-acid--CoA ligase [Cupriavidus basilensis OR16]